MANRPEQLELVDRYQVAGEFAHRFAFERHRELVELGAADEHTRTLLAESAAIVLEQIPALVRDWRVLEREWFETELLDPAGLDAKTQVLTARFAELGPALQALRTRQNKIVAELVDLLDKAREA